jgi:hypothetical protein
MKTMTTNELRAYEIGIKEANEKRTIVPACRSERMMNLLGENNGGLGDSIPLLDAYNSGVAYEINRQTRLEF